MDKIDKAIDADIDAAIEKKHETKPQHTPTPWQIAKTWAQTSIVDTARKGAWLEIAKTGLPEDAAFIVKAVNAYEADQAELARLRDCHEDFVSACEKVIKVLRHGLLLDSKDLDVMAELLETVIAKAEGR